ncbi:glycosyltransferase family 39 protein [Streptomyces sp. NPDC047072]|uniref:glycosyltransferase family 39 protein n=1 Tax=Streptomyces sp. NPDC047072 TaxID=3154809 RepID=UPI0033CBD91E
MAPAVLALVLGLWGVRRGGSIWRDEVVSYDMARRPLPDLWAALGHADAVHGLYYLLLHGLFRIAGDTDPLLVLRLPSVLAIAVAAGTLALLGSRLAGPRAGLLAGLVFAVLPPVQRYAQEGRSYALVCALVIWATYLLVRAADRRGPWLPYGMVMLTACLLHEFAVLVLPAHLLAVLHRTALRAALAVCVGLAPLAVLSSRQSEQVAWIGGLGVGALAGFAGVGAVGVACAILLGSRPVTRLAVPLTILPALVLILLTPLKPLYVDRYVLYGHAGTALLLGAALDDLPRRAGRVRTVALLAAGAALLSLLPVALHLRTPQSRTDDATAVAGAIGAMDADGVLYLPSRRRVWSLTALSGLVDVALARTPTASATLYGTEAAPSVIRARMLATARIVVVEDPPDQPRDRSPQEVVKRRVLERCFVRDSVRRLQGAQISRYVRRCAPYAPPARTRPPAGARSPRP